jgi:dolichol-phosphate mannosyltransferase
MPPSPVLKSTQVVSIIVPMCNEEESIDLLREKLGRLQHRIGQNFAIEYCMVDDGSTDGTWNLMRSAVPQSATYVMRRHDRNRGVGAAIRTGLEVASGSIVCTIDADCSYPPEDLCALIDLVACGDADVAVASPYHPAGGVVGVKRWRILLSRQCSLLYRFVSPLKIHTYTSIFRAYTGNAATRLKFGSDGFVSAVEILMCAHRMGYRVREVPLVLHARQRGYSKIRIAKTICAHLGLIMREAQVGIMDALGASNRPPSHSANQSKHVSPLAVSGQFGEEETPVG